MGLLLWHHKKRATHVLNILKRDFQFPTWKYKSLANNKKTKLNQGSIYNTGISYHIIRPVLYNTQRLQSRQRDETFLMITRRKANNNQNNNIPKDIIQRNKGALLNRSHKLDSSNLHQPFNPLHRAGNWPSLLSSRRTLKKKGAE